MSLPSHALETTVSIQERNEYAASFPALIRAMPQVFCSAQLAKGSICIAVISHRTRVTELVGVVCWVFFVSVGLSRAQFIFH